MRDERVVAFVGDAHFDHIAATGRNGDGLHPDLLVGGVAIRIGGGKQRADDMEGAVGGGASVADIQADQFAGVGDERIGLILVGIAVEDNEIGLYLRGLEIIATIDTLIVGLTEVELMLDEDILAVGFFRPASFRLDDDRAVHPIDEVQEDGRRTAVIHENAGVFGRPREFMLLTRIDGLIVFIPREQRGVKVDAVRHHAGIVDHGEVYGFAFHDVDGWPRPAAIERPEFIGRIGRDLFDDMRRV